MVTMIFVFFSLVVVAVSVAANVVPIAEVVVDAVPTDATPATVSTTETTPNYLQVAPPPPHPVVNPQTLANPLPQPPAFPLSRNYNFQVSAIPIPYEPRYFTDRTKSDMIEFLDRATRDVDFAESQISLATEFARSAISKDVNDAKNFVITNHEKQLKEAVEIAHDEDELWECVKTGEKSIEMKARIMADRANDCVKRAAIAAMDVVASTKSHIAEDRIRRLQKYSDDVERLTACVLQQDRHCVREQINLIDRNVESLAADARGEVERVREARREQIAEFGVCRRFQDQSYLQLLEESDSIVECCLKRSPAGFAKTCL